MQYLVIDKSYLKSAKKDKISELSKNYVLLMPFSLLFELTKKEPKERAMLFKKFDDKKRYQLLPNFSEVFFKEIESGQRIIPSNYIKNKDYSIHNQLCDENYKFTKQQNTLLEEEKDRIEERLTVFLNVIEDFMEEKINFNEKNLNNNEEYIKKYIGYLLKYYNRNACDPNIFNSEFFIYQWVIILHLFAKDLSSRYESLETIKKSEKVKEKIRHDLLDMEYLLFAVMEKNFATKEKKLINWFKQLSINGICITD